MIYFVLNGEHILWIAMLQISVLYHNRKKCKDRG